MCFTHSFARHSLVHSLFVVGMLMLSAACRSQDTSPSDGDRVSMTAIDELSKYIESARVDWQVPGLAVAIVKDDKLVMAKGFGVKREGTSDPVDGQTLFAIASNSKAFTSAALAMLVEEGKLSWDDRVQKHLPWLQLNDTLASQDLRIRDLLCHRSGLGIFSGDLLWYGTPYTPKEILMRARYLKPEGPFRAHYGYSNLMFLAAGEVIETVSGEPWSKFIQKRFFEPLEMNRSTTSIKDLLAKDNFATPHKTHLDSSEPIAWVNWDSMAAAGGIVSSVEDMSQWLRLQLRRGALDDSRRLFSEDSSRTMWEAHTPIAVSKRYNARFPSTHFRAYGLGWALADYQGRKLVSHGGGYDGMYSQVVLVPEENLGVVVLTNSMTGISESITYRVLDHYFGLPARDWSSENLPTFKKSREEFKARIEKTITPVASGTLPSHPLTSYQGSFRCPMFGDAKVELANDRLVLRLLANPQLVADLEHLHYDTFVIRWREKFAWFDEGTAHFVANAKGEFNQIQLDVPNDDLWFHEIDLRRVSEK